MTRINPFGVKAIPLGESMVVSSNVPHFEPLLIDDDT